MSLCNTHITKNLPSSTHSCEPLLVRCNSWAELRTQPWTWAVSLGPHTAPRVLCLGFYKDGSHSPGSTFQSFCIMWSSAPAALLSPHCLAASRGNKQGTGRHGDWSSVALSNPASLLINILEGLPTLFLHLMLKQFGRLINSNLLFSSYGIARVSHWKLLKLHEEFESVDMRVSWLSLFVPASVATEEGAVSSVMLWSKQSSVREVFHTFVRKQKWIYI